MPAFYANVATGIAIFAMRPIVILVEELSVMSACSLPPQRSVICADKEIAHLMMMVHRAMRKIPQMRKAS